MTVLWNSGRRIFGIGGSDCHLRPDERNPNAAEPSIYGDPATYVFCDDGLDGEALIQNLRQGRVYLERRCDLRFSINRGSCLPGTNIGENLVHYEISVGDRQRKYQAEFVADGRIIARIFLGRQAIGYDVDMNPYRWLRVDIRRESGEFEGLINPVYNGEHPCFKAPSLHTWGQLMTAITQSRNPGP